MAPLLSCSSSRLSNGETESVKTMIVHDEGESDAGSTPCKDSTLIVRQVLAGNEQNQAASYFLFCFVIGSFTPQVLPSCFPVVLIMFCSCILCGRGEQLSVTKLRVGRV